MEILNLFQNAEENHNIEQSHCQSLKQTPILCCIYNLKTPIIIVLVSFRAEIIVIQAFLRTKEQIFDWFYFKERYFYTHRWSQTWTVYKKDWNTEEYFLERVHSHLLTMSNIFSLVSRTATRERSLRGTSPAPCSFPWQWNSEPHHP